MADELATHLINLWRGVTGEPLISAAYKTTLPYLLASIGRDVQDCKCCFLTNIR
jgi:hypothetical protein